MDRITININSRAECALETLSVLTEKSKTEIVNDALLLYLLAQQSQTNGGGVYLRPAPGAELERLHRL